MNSALFQGAWKIGKIMGIPIQAAFFMAYCLWFDNMVPVYLLFPEGSA